MKVNCVRQVPLIFGKVKFRKDLPRRQVVKTLNVEPWKENHKFFIKKNLMMNNETYDLNISTLSVFSLTGNVFSVIAVQW